MKGKEEAEKKTAKKTNTKTVIIICALIVIIVGLAAVVVFLWLRGSEEPKKTTEVRPTIVDEKNADSILQDLEDDSEDTKFRCRMSTEWNFENGKAESKDAYVANADTNHYPVYFEVRLVDTKEVVYTSPTIPVGSEINGLKLDKELPAGDYDTEVVYHLVNDDNEEVSTTAFTIIIHVSE